MYGDDGDPQEEDGSDEGEGKYGLPLLTYHEEIYQSASRLIFILYAIASHSRRKHQGELTNRFLLQPSERLDIIPGRRITKDEAIAITTNRAIGTPHLNTDNNQADKPQDKEHESSQDDNRGEEATLGDEPEEEGDEGDSEGGDGDPVGEVPGGVEAQMMLDFHLHGADADQTARRREHDQHPHVQLDRRPVVPVDARDVALADVRG